LSDHRSDSPTETEAIGARLAAALRPGDVVLIRGELGTGKTTLIRGACRQLGVSDPVASPTFTIGRRYSGRVPVSHLDLFRLEDLAGEEPGMLDDYLTDDAISFVEWPEAAEAAIGADDLGAAGSVVRVAMSHEGGDRRLITIAGPEPWPR
jgi:tRNA threonylcarbamoyladenosine biosynthesis protein TsaE